MGNILRMARRDLSGLISMRSHKHHSGVAGTPCRDRVQPEPQFFQAFFDTVRELEQHQVERVVSQKQLMRVAIDLLPAKVPGRELDAVVGELAQIDPVGGGDGGIVFLAVEMSHQSGFPHGCASHHHQLHLVQRDQCAFQQFLGIADDGLRIGGEGSNAGKQLGSVEQDFGGECWVEMSQTCRD